MCNFQKNTVIKGHKKTQTKIVKFNKEHAGADGKLSERKAGIRFRSIYMDIGTLQMYREDIKLLTGNDRRRLVQLEEELAGRGKQEMEKAAYRNVIEYMLEIAVKGACGSDIMKEINWQIGEKSKWV